MTSASGNLEASSTGRDAETSTVPVLPESTAYRIKRRILGPALPGDAETEPELGVPTALAVFSSDCISSSAYATEEILAVLVPVVGVYAFGLVVPVTVAILVMLAFLILSYRQTIRTYPAAGGAYLVSRENFGDHTALVAGLSLMIGYILTVAVSTSAGVAALTSVFPTLHPWVVELTLGAIALLTWLNLRGTRESGRIFMTPTYAFIALMGLMILVGLFRTLIGGGLESIAVDPGMVGNLAETPHGTRGVADTVLRGAGLWVLMGAFATGASALTGVEAISNGVDTFHPPRWRNARRTLVIMGVTLGVLFLGLSFLSGRVHAAPFADGSPTVISQVGQVVFGDAPAGHGLYLVFQLATLLVLFLGANTSFAGFPRLAGFAAKDAYLPRQLTRRGHRLVYSNGIVLLAACAMALVAVSGASVNRLIPFYGIGVFTSFTMSQAGMAAHHLRTREDHWRRGLALNGGGAAMTATVAVAFLFEFFSDGVWVLVVLIPVLVAVLARLHREYQAEEVELVSEAAELAGRRIMPRSTVLVMVNEVNRATARGLRYARSLQPTELRAVHLAADDRAADRLREQWVTLGLGGIPLQIVDCPDRRVADGAMRAAAAEVGRGEREVTVVIPRILYRRPWLRMLHGRSATAIASALDDLAGVNVTFVPYHLHGGRRRPDLDAPVGAPGAGHRHRAVPTPPVPDRPRSAAAPGDGRHPTARTVTIGGVGFRDHVELDGRVTSIQVHPGSGTATFEVTLDDGTGSIRLVFLGRRSIPGITPGTSLRVIGTVGIHHGRLALLNPRYRIEA